MKLGERIAELRKKTGMTQEELAEKVGVVRQTISKWELGETAPDLEQSKNLADVLKVSLEELVGSQKAIKKQNKYIKYILIIVAFIIVCLVGVKIYIDNNSDIHDENAVDFWHAKCTLDDKTIEYYFKYYRSDSKTKSELFPASMTSVIGITEDDNASDKIFKIQEYYKINNGTCEIIEEDYEG